MVAIKFLKNSGKYKKGDVIELDQEELDLWQQSMPKGVFEVIAAPSEHQPEPDQEEMSMGDVKAYEGIIFENGQDYNITLLTHHVTKYTYKKDEQNAYSGDTSGTFDRYEIKVLYNGEETTARVPPTVVQTMWEKIKKNNAIPVAETKPRFVISKSGTGKQTKWNVNYVGMGQ